MSPAVKRALDYVEKTSGLSWFDYMYFRYQKGTVGDQEQTHSFGSIIISII
jgi:hypothetical protein